MKTKEEIESQIKTAKDQLSDAKEEYSTLGQIDAQSYDGSACLQIINQKRGEIIALEWVLGL